MTELLSMLCLIGAGACFMVFHALLKLPSADIPGSKLTRFFSSVWPGVMLFSLIASGVTLAVYSTIRNMATPYE